MLKINDLSVGYNSTKKLVLDKVSFNVKKGDVIAVFGRSGCGKTTLLNTIAGLYKPGEIFQTGELIVDTDKIANVFQEPRLLPWKTVLENITFVLGDNEIARAKTVLREVGLIDVKNYYPKQLSTGMMQRLNFARAISTKPDLLLLDEPFSSLDDYTKRKLIKEFKSILKKTKTTTVFITHNQYEADTLADRTITLDGPK